MSIRVEFVLDRGLVDVKASIYVNAASISPLPVQGWGGVAGAVHHVLQKDPLSYELLLNDWANKGEHIAKGQADFVRDAMGKPVPLLWPLGSAYLIHAGAPNSGSEKERMEQLKSAYHAILQCTYSILPLLQPSITLAIAPLGIGIYGNPAELSAKAAISAINDFEQHQPNISFSILFPLYNTKPQSPDLIFQQTLLRK